MENFPGVVPYTLADGEVRFLARCVRSDGSKTTKRGFTSARAAHKHRQDALSAARRGEKPPTSRRAFSAAWDAWLARHARYVSDGTIHVYESCGRHRLKPLLGDRRVDKITADDVDRGVDDWLDAGLSVSTINSTVKALGVFLAHAHEQGWIVAAPKLQRLPEEHAEMEFLRDREIGPYLDACQDDYRALAELLIFGGPRIGEALGAHVEDLDVQGSAIRIVRQEKKGAKSRRARAGAAGTKGKQYRTVELPVGVLCTLTDHVARRGEFVPGSPTDRLFGKWEAPRPGLPMTKRLRQERAGIFDDLRAGGMTHAQIAARHDVAKWVVARCRESMPRTSEEPRALTRSFVASRHHEALEDAGIDRAVRVHDLRHTAATLWLAHGKSLVYVQRQLGHRSIVVTERYAHLEQRSADPVLAEMYDRVKAS